MPFLPLYFGLLGVADPGDIAIWSGVSLGVTPAITASLAPFWARLGDRYGRKLMTTADDRFQPTRPATGQEVMAAIARIEQLTSR